MLFWAHREPHPVLPPRLGSVRVVAFAHDLYDFGPTDILVVGAPAFALSLSRVPPGRLLLSWDPVTVERSRALGWAALQLPGPEAAALLRALRNPETLVPVERGTLDLGAGELWTAEGRTALPPRELEELTALVEASPDPTACPRSVARRLKERLGALHIVTLHGRGFAFRALPPAPAPARALPRRLPVALGQTTFDLDGQRICTPQGEVGLTERETAALALLLASPGVVSRSELAGALGVKGRHACDLAVHRLRHKLGPVELRTVRGQGYRLVRAPARPEPPLPALPQTDLERALRGSPLVTVTGPCGVGKSHAAKQVCEGLVATYIDVHGVAPKRVQQLLQRHRSGLLVLDGLDDALLLARPLSEALGRGVRLLLTARAAAELPVEQEIKLQPWSLEAMRALHPDASEAHDGLPLAVLDPSDLEARLAQAPDALRRLSVFQDSFDAQDAALAGASPPPSALARLSWLEGHGPWRLYRPHLAALRRRWTEEDRERQERLAPLRTRRALDARPFRPERVRACMGDLVEAHERLQTPELAALRADAEQELKCESGVDWLARASAQAQDPSVRAELLYHMGLRDPTVRLDCFRQAAALAAGERQIELLLEVAWILSASPCSPEFLALREEARTRLARLPPNEALFARAELVILDSLDSPAGPEAIEPLTQMLGQLEPASYSAGMAGHRKILAARRELALRLSNLLVWMGRLEDAEVALLAAQQTTEKTYAFLIEARARAAIAAGRLIEAEALLARLEASDTSPSLVATVMGWRALLWIRRGEARRALPLLAQAEALQDVNESRRNFVKTVQAWQAAALGDGEGARQHLPEGEPALLAALLEVAAAAACHRQGADPLPALERLMPYLPALEPEDRTTARALLESLGLALPSG